MTVDGKARVVLLREGHRYPVPGHVEPGKYHILATFPGEPEVDTATITVTDGGAGIVCNDAMEVCKPK